MKTRLHAFLPGLLAVLVCAFCTPGSTIAQEILVNGSFEEEEEGWTLTQLNGDTDMGYEFVTGDECPSEGSDTCLKFEVDAMTTNFAVWQEVTLIAGESYQATAAFRGISTQLSENWAEVVLADGPPVDNEDWPGEVAEGVRLYGFVYWDECNGAGVDGTFEDDGCTGVLVDTDEGYVVPGDEGEEVTMYYGVKVGRWNEAASQHLEISVDNLSLTGATVTSAEEPGQIPERIAIESVYPNPFNPMTTATVEIHMAGRYTLRVFNVLGQAVYTREISAQSPGRMEMPLELSNQPSGIYMISVEHPATGYVDTARAVLIK